jgi:hypothetical protein
MTKLFQSDTDSMQNWCSECGVILNFGKTMIMSFIRKTIIFNFNYKLCNNLILQSHCVKDHGVLLDCKLCFHRHINYMFSQGLKCWVSFDILLLISPLLMSYVFCYHPCGAHT